MTMLWLLIGLSSVGGVGPAYTLMTGIAGTGPTALGVNGTGPLGLEVDGTSPTALAVSGVSGSGG